jgi:hypothetical protein
MEMQVKEEKREVAQYFSSKGVPLDRLIDTSIALVCDPYISDIPQGTLNDIRNRVASDPRGYIVGKIHDLSANGDKRPIGIVVHLSGILDLPSTQCALKKIKDAVLEGLTALLPKNLQCPVTMGCEINREGNSFTFALSPSGDIWQDTQIGRYP